MHPRALATTVTLFILAMASRALASEPFPEVIQSQLLLAAAPPCTYCHETDLGGLMTINKPLGRTLQQKYGVRFLDVAGLRAAIMQMQESGVDDSDGDRIGDIVELKQGTNPNVPEGGTLEEARYGCYCSAVRQSAPMGAGAAWLSGLALALVRRRRAGFRQQGNQT